MSKSHSRCASASLLAWALPTLVASISAQERVLSQQDYISPPGPIYEFLDSDARNAIRLSNLGPDGDHFLIGKSGGMTPLAKMGRPYAYLAETAIDHIALRSRGLSTGHTLGYYLVSARSDEQVHFDIPEGITHVSNGSFSPAGDRVAFYGHSDNATHLYVADVATGQTYQVTSRQVLATLVSNFQWTWDSQQLLSVLVVADATDAPSVGVANEPIIWRNREGNTTARTQRFLLKNSDDKALLEFVATGQLALVDVNTGDTTEIGEPAMFRNIEVSNDGQHFRVTTMQKPFNITSSTR